MMHELEEHRKNAQFDQCYKLLKLLGCFMYHESEQDIIDLCFFVLQQETMEEHRWAVTVVQRRAQIHMIEVCQPER